jgi:sugar/nucleoside kinase (ribokinase family)
MQSSLDYLLVGHITADLTPNGRLLGGTVSFCAAVAKAFGLNVRVVTSAARGEPLLAQLEPYVSEMIVLPADSTSTFENIYGPNGRTQYIRGVAAPISVNHVPGEWFTTPLVHLAPLTGEVDPQLAHRFRNSTVLLTLQGWLREWGSDGRVRFKRWLDPEVLRHIDIVVFSEEDIVEAPDLEAAFAQVTRHLFVTRAEKGGTYYHLGQPFHYDTPQVEVMNPTGAGDVFAASLLASLPIFDNDFYRAVKVAAVLAALSTTRVGLASAPSPEEVQHVLDEVRT